MNLICPLLVIAFLATLARHCTSRFVKISHAELHRPTLPHSTRIVGGKRVSDGSAKYMVTVVICFRNVSSIYAFCGGSMMNRRWVLTAAHCLNDPPNGTGPNLRDSYIYIGGRRIFGKRWMNLKAAYLHRDWNNRTANDLALIRLKRRIAKKNYYPLKLVRSQEKMPPFGTTALTMGFGSLNGSIGNFSNTLMQARLNYVPFASCLPQNITEDIMQILDRPSQICAVTPGFPTNFTNSICHGDSGGPLFYRKPSGTAVQIGITSFLGGECTIPGVPIFFAKISKFARDIRGRIAGKRRKAWNKYVSI